MSQTISCSDFSFPLLPHHHALDLIRTLGFDGVDVGLFDQGSHLTPAAALADVGGSSRALRQRLDERGLCCSDIYLTPGGLRDLAVNHPDAPERRRAREVFLRALEFVGGCDAKHLTGLPGMPWPDLETVDDSFSRARDELAWRVERARAAGVAFAVEPHVGSIIATPQIAARLVEQTPELTLTLDYGHFTCQGIADEQVEPLLSVSSHCHVRGAATGRLQMPLGQSQIDHERMIRAMPARGYTGAVAAEYIWDPHDRCNEADVLSETILALQLIRRAMGEEHLSERPKEGTK